MNNLVYYDFEVFSQDWLFIANLDDCFVIIHNDKNKLAEFVQRYIDYWFIGYNNYHYDDLILTDILNGNNPHQLSKRIIEHEKIKMELIPNFKSLDLMQDIQKDSNNKRISLKKIMGNLGLSIIESSVPFDLERSLTSAEIEEIIKYCSNDVLGVKELYKYRSKYFETKLTLINEFQLPIDSIRLVSNY